MESAFDRNNGVIQSLLDTDYYTFTMMQAVLHNYPNVEVEWEFRCRNSEDLRPYLAEIRFQVERLAELSLSADQLSFLERISFLKPDFCGSSACSASTCATSTWPPSMAS